MKRKLPVLVAIVVAACLAGLTLRRSGISVEVRNEEAFALREVEVRTTAGTYALGELAPGASASTVVGAKGESSVTVVWTTPDGSQHSSKGMGYFEGSPQRTGVYGGSMEFSIGNGMAQDADDTTFSPINMLRLLPAKTASR